jgi:Domain of unknown function (DUF4149)
VSRSLRIGLGLWAGLLVWLAVLVAPILFAQLPDRILAGAVAGDLFRWATFLSVGFGSALAVLSPAPWRTRALLLGPAALLLVNELLLRPAMQAARLAGAGFAIWHGLASGLYVLATGLVVALWWRAERTPVRREG